MARKQKRSRGAPGPRAAAQAPAREQGDPREVPALLEALVESTGTKLADEPMRELKRIARESPSTIKEIFQGCMARMRTQHSQVRYMTLLIIDALVMRSRDFRRLLVPSLPALLPLLLGHVAGSPLPPPRPRAKLLTDTALECLQRWAIVFGAHPHYIHLLLARRFVEGTLRMKLPDLRARASAEERERVARRERTQALLAAKFEKVKEEVPRVRAELSSALQEMERCLGLITAGRHNGAQQPLPPTSSQNPVGREETGESRQDEEDRAGSSEVEEEVEWDAGEHSAEAGALQEHEDAWAEAPSAMRAAALELAALQERQEHMVQQQTALPSVFRLLQDLLGTMQKQWLPTTEAWVTVLSRVEDIDLAQAHERDSLLRVAIDLRSELKAMERRCLEAGVRVPAEGSQREVDDPTRAAPSDALAPQDQDCSATAAGASRSGLKSAQNPTEIKDSAIGAEVHPVASTNGQAGELPPVQQRTSPRPLELQEANPSPSTKVRSKASTRACKKRGLNGTDGCSLQPQAPSSVADDKGSAGEARAEAGADGAEGGEAPQQKKRKLEDLHKVAPVLPWGMHLEYWGEDSVPVNPRGMEVQNHWGPVDEGACMPQERLHELTLAMSTYKPRRTAASPRVYDTGASGTVGKNANEGSGKVAPKAEHLDGAVPSDDSPQASISPAGAEQALQNPHPSNNDSLNALESPGSRAALQQAPGAGKSEEAQRVAGGSGGLAWPNGNWAKVVRGIHTGATRETGSGGDGAQAQAGPSSDESVVRQLARRALCNVRAADTRKGGSAAAARAHNDSVLRRAAAQGLPVPAEGEQGPLPGTRDREQRNERRGPAAALRAMLKPPASSKARLRAALERKRRRGSGGDNEMDDS